MYVRSPRMRAEFFVDDDVLGALRAGDTEDARCNSTSRAVLALAGARGRLRS